MLLRSASPRGAALLVELWSGVRAKPGWWRNHKFDEQSQRPPECLFGELHINSAATGPACAFSRCIFPAACTGEFWDKATNKTTSCNGTKGYKEDGCYDHVTARDISRCRLCGTCIEGYKRTGHGTRCKKCPPSATNRALLAVGFLMMIAGTSVLIYMTSQEQDGDEETSDAVKKS